MRSALAATVPRFLLQKATAACGASTAAAGPPVAANTHTHSQDLAALPALSVAQAAAGADQVYSSCQGGSSGGPSHSDGGSSNSTSGSTSCTSTCCTSAAPMASALLGAAGPHAATASVATASTYVRGAAPSPSCALTLPGGSTSTNTGRQPASRCAGGGSDAFASTYTCVPSLSTVAAAMPSDAAAAWACSGLLAGRRHPLAAIAPAGASGAHGCQLRGPRRVLWAGAHQFPSLHGRGAGVVVRAAAGGPGGGGAAGGSRSASPGVEAAGMYDATSSDSSSSARVRRGSRKAAATAVGGDTSRGPEVEGVATPALVAPKRRGRPPGSGSSGRSSSSSSPAESPAASVDSAAPLFEARAGAGTGLGAAGAGPGLTAGLSGGARGMSTSTPSDISSDSSSSTGPPTALPGVPYSAPGEPAAAERTSTPTSAASPAPPASPGLAVWDLPGMSRGVPAPHSAPGPAPARASAEELLAAIRARAPGQYDVLLMVQELLPYLRHATSDGPLHGYVFDVETSGTALHSDFITELAVMDLATGEQFATLINPHGPGRPVDLSVRVQNITHITPAMLLHAPYEAWVVLALLCWVYQRCRAAGSARPTFIGHNAAAFDRLFVGRLAAYYGCVLPPSWALVDTLRVAKQWGVQHQGSASLASLRERYGLSNADAHRALPDVQHTTCVLAAMLDDTDPRVASARRDTQAQGLAAAAGGGPLPEPFVPPADCPSGWRVQLALNDGSLAAYTEQLLSWTEVHKLLHSVNRRALQREAAWLSSTTSTTTTSTGMGSASVGSTDGGTVTEEVYYAAAASATVGGGGGGGTISAAAAAAPSAASSLPTRRLSALLAKTQSAWAMAWQLQPSDHGAAWGSHPPVPWRWVCPPMPLYDLPHPGEALEPLPAPGAAGRSRSGGRPGRSPAAGPLGVALSSLEADGGGHQEAMQQLLRPARARSPGAAAAPTTTRTTNSNSLFPAPTNPTNSSSSPSVDATPCGFTAASSAAAMSTSTVTTRAGTFTITETAEYAVTAASGSQAPPSTPPSVTTITFTPHGSPPSPPPPPPPPSSLPAPASPSSSSSAAKASKASTKKAKAAPPAPPAAPTPGWTLLGSSFADPEHTPTWKQLLPRARTLLPKLQAASGPNQLPTPHALLMHVPREVTLYGRGLDWSTAGGTAGGLAGLHVAKEEAYDRLGTWKAVRDEVRAAKGVHTAMRVTLEDVRVFRLQPRGWAMTAAMRPLAGELRGAPPGVDLEAAWYDFANFRADKVFQERRAEWGKRGSEWVVRGTVRAKAMDGLRFEVVSPDVLPAASFDPPAHCVTVTHRACGGLAAGEVGELAGGLLDAARGGKIALPDPLPPSARQQLHQLLTANYPNYFADLLPDATANTTAAATDSPRGSSTGPDQAQDPDYATYTARAAAAAAGEAAVAGGAAVPGRTGARGRGVRSRTAAALTANTTASSSSGSSLSTDSGTGGSTDDNGVPYMDVPSLVEAYDVLHRPRVEHLMPVRVRQPPESSAGAASTANRQPLPPLLTPYQVAGRVVAFHELFFSQMRMQQLRSRVRAPNWAPVSADAAVDAACRCLGFTLTGAQRRVVGEVLRDMGPGSASTMYRLLQGDVGSGKTVVALLAMLAAAACGYQALLVVPTTVLAAQHHAKLCALVEALPLAARKRLWGGAAGGDLEPLLLTGETKSRDKRLALSALADGSRLLAVGTHGLLNVPALHRLGLVVLDESHKFGVAQLEKLSSLMANQGQQQEGQEGQEGQGQGQGPGQGQGQGQGPPHLLNMTATPIPRTLAAAMYGHMDVSRIDEMPPGRTPVVTKIVEDDTAVPYTDPYALRKMEAMWQEVLRELTTGDPPGRGFVVYPLRQASASAAGWLGGGGGVGAPEGLSEAKARSLAAEDLKNATDQAEQLASYFEPHGVRCRLLHGRMSGEDKQAALEAFRRGDVRLLVCTTVVEVGVDVPEATVVVVEHAERFGLAQLHQLRGRVGRGGGGRGGSCYLCIPFGDVGTARRLGVMERTNDGFAVAEWDLAQRGMGEMFGSGVRQSGRLDVSRLTEAVLQDAVPRSVGVALVEAAREAAAAAPGLAAAAGPGEAEGEGSQGPGGGAEGQDQGWLLAEAMRVFRPQELSAAEGLLPV